MLSTFHGHLKIILEGHKNNRIYSDYLWEQGLVMDGVHLSLGAFLPEFSDVLLKKKILTVVTWVVNLLVILRFVFSISSCIKKSVCFGKSMMC